MLTEREQYPNIHAARSLGGNSMAQADAMLGIIAGDVKRSQCRQPDGTSCAHYNPYAEARGFLFPCTHSEGSRHPGFSPTGAQPFRCANYAAGRVKHFQMAEDGSWR